MAEQTVGWALHALEPEDEFAVIEHLAGCEHCQRLAVDVSEVTSGLATALPQHQPPAGLRESIVEQARRTPQHDRAGNAAGERPVPGDRLDVGDPGRHTAPRHA